MKKDKYVVGIGAANVDIYGKSKIDIRTSFDHPSIINTTIGGVTRNILENSAKLGVKTYLLTAIGNDIYGTLILDHCAKKGINVDKVLKIKDDNTGIFIQVKDKDNDMHLAICDMSVIANINEDYLKKNYKLIKNASAIVLDPSLETSTIEYILDEFKDIPTFLDPISDFLAKKIRPYLSKLYCIKPNKNELAVLASMEIKNNDDLIKAYKKVNKKVKKLYVSLGKDGCMYTNEAGEVVKKKFSVVKMVNASGAGDALMSALVYGFINNKNIDDTINYGLAAGTATVGVETTINQNLSVKLLDRIIKENNKQ